MDALALRADEGRIKKYSSPRGDGKFSSLSIGLKFSKLRNIAPREGTETKLRCSAKQSY